MRNWILCLLCFVCTQTFTQCEDLEDLDLEVGKTVHLEDGLQVTVTKKVKNCVKRATEGDVLLVDYVGRYHGKHGEINDDTKKKGFPYKFMVGEGRSIVGMDRVVRGMCKGETRELFIPHKLA